MFRFIVILLLFIGVALGENRAIIIFDASGSMWGQIDGKPKIAIAKDALKSVVKGWSEKSELGLMAYGHRRKGDCNDIEILIPVSKVDKNKIINAVMNISPKGKTPISRSLKKAAHELKFSEDKATVILISDGKETCDPNPCQVAKELKSEGIDFIAHVIGFNVDSKTDKELACIAKATGGEYFSAKNAQQLNRAIKEVAKKTQKPTPPPKPKVKKLKHNLQISASESQGSKWIRAEHNLYQDGSFIKGCVSYKDKPCLLNIPAGKYKVISKYNQLKVKNDIELNSTTLKKLHVIMGQTGKVTITAKENNKRVQANFRFWKGNKYIKGCTTYEGKDCQIRIPAGEYIMKTKYAYDGVANVFRSSQKVTINPQENKKIPVNFHALYFHSKGIIPCLKVEYEILKPTGESLISKSAMAKDKIKVVLPKGEYYIDANSFDKRAKAKVIVGEDKEVAIDFKGSEEYEPFNAIWKVRGVSNEVRFSQNGTKIKGKYSTDNGEIIGELTFPQRFEGYWIEDESNHKCSTPKNGRYYWGRLILALDKERCRARSDWSYCNKKPKISDFYESYYIKPLPKKESKEELIKADSIEPKSTKKEIPNSSAKEVQELQEKLKKAKELIKNLSQATTKKDNNNKEF